METIGNWQGPISLAVFVTSFEEWRGLNLFVKFYRRCNPLFKKFVSIHVAIPTATALNDFMVESEEFRKVSLQIFQVGGVSLTGFKTRHPNSQISRGRD